MKKAIPMGLCIMLILSFQAAAQTPPSVASILERIDRNAVAGSKIVTSEMIIHGRRSSRSLSSKSWIQGYDNAFTEYLAPPREKGIKMLKLGDQLWTYSPDADRTISISGHMLRQSVMGSDLSYEDMMEDRAIGEVYNGTIAGEEILLERPCWILELTSKAENVAYHSRKIWVDQERFVVLKEERFAKSGKLLKTLEVKSVIRVQNRWIQDALVFKDVLKGGEGTKFRILAIEFDVPIAEHIFSKASLRK